MRKKVWNEHIKLVATLFNAVSIGVLGVAVIGPLAQPDNPFYGAASNLAGFEKLEGMNAPEKLQVFNDLLTSVPWYNVVEWKAVAVALALHALAHIITRAQIDE